MAKFLKVKFEYEDGIEKIAVTRVEEQPGRLTAYNGDQKVGEFSTAKIERWWVS
jgi:hypothetical protein